jgi:3-oxoacyl-[acyl-carrier protein] reductase
MPDRDTRRSVLAVGQSFTFERDVTESDIAMFAQLTGDLNPLHLDSAYAASTNYGRRIAHGAFQVGVASAMAGMHLPGRDVLLGGINARFPAPLYYPARVSVTGTITTWNEGSGSGRLEVVLTDVATRDRTAEVFMSFTLHEKVAAPRAAERIAGRRSPKASGKPRLMVTGASGALGAAICADLAADYAITAISRIRPAPSEVGKLPDFTHVKLDLLDESFEEKLRDVTSGAPLYAIVHAAWPGAPAGGLLHGDPKMIDEQLRAGTRVPMALARMLFDSVGEHGGRFIAIGSIAGSEKPHLAKGGYSLGKAALEHTVRLLAPELARKGITANVVSPSFIAAGINSRATERQQLLEASTIPAGRLCTVDDVVKTVRFLLSSNASFVSGQNIVLSGGQV